MRDHFQEIGRLKAIEFLVAETLRLAAGDQMITAQLDDVLAVIDVLLARYRSAID